MSKGAPSAAAVRRLARDMAELARDPLPCVSAAPVGDSVTEWHVNLCAPDGPFAGVPVHAEMRFPADYPSSPPDVKLLTPIPHTNVFGSWICLDMLKSYMTTTPYEGWSTAYTAGSVLRQLQSFLFADRVDQMGGGDYALENAVTDEQVLRAARFAVRFKCPHAHCPHVGHAPHPALPPAHTAAVRADLIDWVIGRADGEQLNRRERRRLNATSEALQAAAAELRASVTRAGPASAGAAASVPDGRAWPLNEDLTNFVFEFLGVEDLHLVRAARDPFACHVLNKFQVLERRELLCYHRRVSFTEDVLGVGLLVETAGRRGDRVRAIRPRMDLLSAAAFYEDSVRLSVWKEPFNHFLPLVICESHGRRAWSTILASLTTLAGDRDFSPLAGLGVVQKLMNNVVVRFCMDDGAARKGRGDGGRKEVVDDYGRAHKVVDHGAFHSEAALTQYVGFHHLLVALAVRYPEVTAEANRRVAAFLRGPAGRNKRAVPDLGEFLVLLAVADRSWSDVARPVVRELFARQVKWVRKELPGFDSRDLSPCARLTYHWRHSTTGLRLLAFQTFFLREVACRPSLSVRGALAAYNRRLGQPPPRMAARLQRAVTYIRERVTTWVPFFACCRVECPTPGQLFGLLDSAVDQSAKERYHTSRGRHSRPTTERQCLCRPGMGGCQFVARRVPPVAAQPVAVAAQPVEVAALPAVEDVAAQPVEVPDSAPPKPTPKPAEPVPHRPTDVLVPLPHPVPEHDVSDASGTRTLNPALRRALFSLFEANSSAGGANAPSSSCSDWLARSARRMSRDQLAGYFRRASLGSVTEVDRATEARIADQVQDVLGLTAARVDLSSGAGLTLRQFIAFYVAVASSSNGGQAAVRADLRAHGFTATFTRVWAAPEPRQPSPPARQPQAAAPAAAAAPRGPQRPARDPRRHERRQRQRPRREARPAALVAPAAPNPSVVHFGRKQRRRIVAIEHARARPDGPRRRAAAHSPAGGAATNPYEALEDSSDDDDGLSMPKPARSISGDAARRRRCLASFGLAVPPAASSAASPMPHAPSA